MSGDKTVRAKLRDAMAEMGNPTKSKTANVPTKNGGKYQYKYTTLVEVLGIVRPALQSAGLDLMQSVGFTESGLTLRTSVFDDDSELVLDERPMKQCADPQDFGSYETYMRRYALVTAFGLGAEDDDGQRAHQASYQPRKSEHKQSDSSRVAGGVSALMEVSERIKQLTGVSPWTRDTLKPILEPLSDAEKVAWLEKSYTDAKRQLEAAAGGRSA